MSRDERGAVTPMVLGVMVLILTIGLGVAVVAGYVAALHQARQTADLAAVSGASAAGRGDQGCPIAERVARGNGAVPVACEQVGDYLEYVVTVEVRVPVRPPFPGLPNGVNARADAGFVTGA